MNYYPLLEVNGSSGFVSLSNFPPTGNWDRKECFVYAAQPDGKRWVVTSCGVLPAGQIKKFSRESGGFDPSRSVFFFMSEISNLQSQLETLADPCRYQFATPRWRGTLGISGEKMDVSYAGEYPDEMLPLSKSSCISLSPLLQLGDHVKTTILFVNMLKRPDVAPSKARLVCASSKEVLLEWIVQSNTVNECEVSKDIAQKLNNSLVNFIVDGITGIPVYLSLDENSGKMSLEHSHPPVEFLVFGEALARGKLVRSIKQEWL